MHTHDVAAAAGISERRAYELLRAVRGRGANIVTRLRCLDCQDGRHTGSVPVGSLLAMPLPGLRPPPFQARLFSHA